MGNLVRMQPPEPQEDLLTKFGRMSALKGMLQGQQTNELELQERRRAMQTRLAISEAISKAGSLEAALPEIKKISPEYGLKIENEIKESKSWDAKTRHDKTLEAQAQTNSIIAKIQGVEDQAGYDAAIAEVRKFPGIDQGLVEYYAGIPFSPRLKKHIESQLGYDKQQADIAAENSRKALQDEQRRGAKAQARMAEQEAELTPQERANLKERRNLPGQDVPYPADVEAQKRRLQPPQTVVIQTVDAAGNPISKIVPKQSGSEFAAPPTADMRNKEAARKLLIPAIGQIEGLGKRVITEKTAIVQKAKSVGRSVDAALANDPDYRVYQDGRFALAGNLAVAQQGARPSDADIKAVWLPLVPNVFADTTESARMKWELIRVMSGLTSAGAQPPPQGGQDEFSQFGGVSR